MRRLGTEGWAGIAMLIIAVAVALPALLGLVDPSIPRPLWAALLLVYILAVVLSEWWPHHRLRSLTALAVAVLASWVLVLTVQGMGLIVVLVVVTAALSTYVVPLAISLLIAGLNSLVVLLASMQVSGWTEVLMLTGFYLLIQLATVFSSATLLREKQVRSELAQAHVDLKAAGILLAESTRATERLRISRELHDVIGHQLTVLTLNLEAARHLEGEQAVRHVDKADEVARGLLRDVRSTVGEMRTRPTDLQRALEEMVEGIPALAVDIAVDPGLDLAEEQQVAFIRLAQEAVTNTIRHSEAARLHIDVSDDGGQVTLVARDDGIGAESPQLGNGLCGLRERFEDLGGELTVDGTDGFALTGRMATA